MPGKLHFRSNDPEQEDVQVEQLQHATFCPRCRLIVLGVDDPTRKEMVARWKALQTEPPREPKPGEKP